MGNRFKLKPKQFEKRRNESRTFKDWCLEKNNDTNYDSEKIRKQNLEITTPTEEIHEIIEKIRKRLKEEDKL